MVTRSAAKKYDPEYSVRFLIAAAGNATMAQSPAVVRAGAELLGCHTLPICNDLRLHFRCFFLLWLQSLSRSMQG